MTKVADNQIRAKTKVKSEFKEEVQQQIKGAQKKQKQKFGKLGGKKRVVRNSEKPLGTI